jgi:hypothetical protein
VDATVIAQSARELSSDNAATGCRDTGVSREPTDSHHANCAQEWLGELLQPAAEIPAPSNAMPCDGGDQGNLQIFSGIRRAGLPMPGYLAPLSFPPPLDDEFYSLVFY